MLAATIGVVSEFVQTRLLSDVITRSSEPDAPDAVHRPHLLFSRSPSN
jgi:hypothetical protein